MRGALQVDASAMTYNVMQGDCLEVMGILPDCIFDSVVTDPPAGISFMGRKWDGDKGGRDQWIAWLTTVMVEVLRVLKPGGHALVWSLPRTSHWTATAMENAGFEIRDRIGHLFATGFPKSKNVGRGWGTALKPAVEDWWLCRKPLIGTVAANVQRFGTGALNIDACRVPLIGEADSAEFANNHAVTERLPADRAGQPLGLHEGGWKQRVGPVVVPPGRWPANLLTDGSDEVLVCFPDSKGQQGDLKGHDKKRKSPNGCFGGMAPAADHVARRDAGSAARFFYCTKATRKDRNEGCEGIAKKDLNWSSGTQSPGTFQSPSTDRSSANHHPTLKSTTLMRYLCRLVTPPGGTVFDPFAGSGSTGKAAILEGFDTVLIEQEAEYIPIIEARCAHAEKERNESPTAN